MILKASGPVRGLPGRKRRPSLCDIRAAREAEYMPIAQREARERAAAEPRRLAPSVPATAGEKARVRQRLEARRGLSRAAEACDTARPSSAVMLIMPGVLSLISPHDGHWW